MAEEFAEARIVSGEALGAAVPMPVPAVPVAQRRSSYQTAVAVIRPRDLKLVEARIIQEAEIAGEEFFYSIPFKDKEGNVKAVEDGSIDLAYAMMRAMGNCAVETAVEDVSAPDGHHFQFTSTFIDLETGANYTRTVRRNAQDPRLAGIRGKDPQRAYDMAFGAAQSISQRNAIKAGVPGVLWKKAVERAKQVAANRLSDDTPARSIQKAVDLFKGMGVGLAQIEKALGKSKDEWGKEEIIRLRGFYKAISDGMATKESLFPPVEPPKPEAPPAQEAQGEPEKDLACGGKIEGPAPPEPETAGDGALFGSTTAPAPEPPKARGKKATAKADQDEEAKLRAECAKLAEEKKVPWEEIARFFPGDSLDTMPGSALPALKQFLLSRS
jgi:hypothetical protein